MAVIAHQTGVEWQERLGLVVEAIRAWPDWRGEVARRMRAEEGTAVQGQAALYAYAQYVRDFITLMCAVLGKAPAADERFWKLAMNLHDELGGFTGIDAAHGKMLRGIGDQLDETTRQRCREAVETAHRGLHDQLAMLDWPINLFALGPGTESISDLFLVPLEHWGAKAAKASAGAQLYFDSHRPQVESEHQMEIRRVIAMELEQMDPSEASVIWNSGVNAAEATARIHLAALENGFRVSLAATEAQ